MLHKDEFLGAHPEIHTGVMAYSVDGEKLGRVEMLDEDSITIEKGWFFPKDFTIRYDDVVDIRDDSVIIGENRTELEDWRSEEYAGWNEYERARRREEEARIPLREEELEAEKIRREGEVRLRKVVHTEMKRMKVPVTKEDVVVERVPADEARAPESEAGAFREDETRIPPVEEEVEVAKQPPVKEEVRARKERRTEHRDDSGEVRKEDVEAERDRAAGKR